MHTPDDRWDDVLLAAGFEVDPDAALTGRVADELGGDPELDDPWADRLPTTTGLTGEQRGYVLAASPAFGAALPEQTLIGDDPLGDADPGAVGDADGQIIEFD